MLITRIKGGGLRDASTQQPIVMAGIHRAPEFLIPGQNKVTRLALAEAFEKKRREREQVLAEREAV